MVMSRGVGVGSIVIGISLLVLAFISLICGAVVVSKMTKPAAVSIGLWGLYVSNDIERCLRWPTELINDWKIIKLLMQSTLTM